MAPFWKKKSRTTTTNTSTEAGSVTDAASTEGDNAEAGNKDGENDRTAPPSAGTGTASGVTGDVGRGFAHGAGRAAGADAWEKIKEFFDKFGGDE
ncbi:hypothetical protein AB0I84_36075 [Streptomyces spectabilis]|uniref:hypothetical protein n=1 Tax=Streptomyces spectabilis TaxID=68270 RepID=UPI0033C1ECC4